MADIVVHGAGGMGQEVADVILGVAADGGGWNLLGFVDDDPELHGAAVLGHLVLGGTAWLADHPVTVAVGIGQPASRARAVRVLAGLGARTAPALVHPTASVGTGTELGEGTVVGARAVLTTEVVVGRFAVVNVGASVSHRCRLGDHATLAPGVHVAGDVVVGDGADVGIGASVIQGLTVGSWSVVGAGAVVVDDVAPDTTVVGCPARVLATRHRGWQR